jgi:hypothetical protein
MAFVGLGRSLRNFAALRETGYLMGGSGRGEEIRHSVDIGVETCSALNFDTHHTSRYPSEVPPLPA